MLEGVSTFYIVRDAEPITRREWEAAVAADTEFALERPGAVTFASGTSLPLPNDGVARWRAHPAGLEVAFRYREGRVAVRRPDEATLAVMARLAAALGAKLVGG